MLLGALAGFDSLIEADCSLSVGSATLYFWLAEVLKRAERTELWRCVRARCLPLVTDSLKLSHVKVAELRHTAVCFVCCIRIKVLITTLEIWTFFSEFQNCCTC